MSTIITISPSVSSSETDLSASWENAGYTHDVDVLEATTVSNLSASWEGVGKSIGGPTLYATSQFLDSGSILTGFELGNHFSVIDDTFEPNRDDDIISSDFPNTQEGTNQWDWNPFPPLPEPTPPARRDQDETRYQKAYSFSRFQPVRVRVFRRG